MAYSFNSKLLALEALTHPSFVTNSDCGDKSYQRLEFFGDALLDVIVTRWLYHQSGPPLNSFELTVARSQAVCNSTLAQICVDTGLYKLLRHGSEMLKRDIQTFATDPKSEEAPKVLGDVFEAVLGAIYSDSGDFGIVTGLVERLVIHPHLRLRLSSSSGCQC